jgi:hypothetical protein
MTSFELCSIIKIKHSPATSNSDLYLQGKYVCLVNNKASYMYVYYRHTTNTSYNKKSGKVGLLLTKYMDTSNHPIIYTLMINAKSYLRLSALVGVRTL